MGLVGLKRRFDPCSARSKDFWTVQYERTSCINGIYHIISFEKTPAQGLRRSEVSEH